MAKIPIYCEHCDTVSTFKHLEIDPNVVFKFSSKNDQAECENCGKCGRIVEGTYEFFGETLTLFRSSSKSIAELNKLFKILENAKEKNISYEELSETIKKEVPELSYLSDVIPRTRVELYAFITILLFTIPTYIQWLQLQETIKQNNQKPAPTTINNYYINQEPKASPIIKKPVIKKKKPGKNEPCFCGSGKKYKKCHGR